MSCLVRTGVEVPVILWQQVHVMEHWQAPGERVNNYNEQYGGVVLELNLCNWYAIIPGGKT